MLGQQIPNYWVKKSTMWHLSNNLCATMIRERDFNDIEAVGFEKEHTFMNRMLNCDSVKF
jgi:hypothetical protein